jgi:hypothetical protein
LMNSCSCACRQETPTEVRISNKDFYSPHSCGSFSGTACDVTVTTSSGTYTVRGKWEGCIDHGKVWVYTRQTNYGLVGRRALFQFRFEQPPQVSRRRGSQ